MIDKGARQREYKREIIRVVSIEIDIILKSNRNIEYIIFRFMNCDIVNRAVPITPITIGY